MQNPVILSYHVGKPNRYKTRRNGNRKIVPGDKAVPSLVQEDQNLQNTRCHVHWSIWLKQCGTTIEIWALNQLYWVSVGKSLSVFAKLALTNISTNSEWVNGSSLEVEWKLGQ